MTVKIRVSAVKPYKEISPEVDGKKLSVVFGIAVKDKVESEELRTEVQKALFPQNVEQAEAKLIAHLTSGDRTEDSYYSLRDSLQAELNEVKKIQANNLDTMYKQQVLYIKNASITLEDSSEVKIGDTRTAIPVESLWSSPEECLVVLLEAYFAEASIRDSLHIKIVETIFNTSSEERAKNSK